MSVAWPFPVKASEPRERDLERRDPVDRARSDEPVRERGRGLHRPDRVGGRRADPDLEQFEDADHGSTFGRRAARGAGPVSMVERNSIGRNRRPPQAAKPPGLGRLARAISCASKHLSSYVDGLLARTLTIGSACSPRSYVRPVCAGFGPLALMISDGSGPYHGRELCARDDGRGVLCVRFSTIDHHGRA